MCHSEERVRKGAEKLTKFQNAKQQGRLDGFFTASAKTKAPSKKDEETKGKAKPSGKRKARILSSYSPHVTVF